MAHLPALSTTPCRRGTGAVTCTYRRCRRNDDVGATHRYGPEQKAGYRHQLVHSLSDMKTFRCHCGNTVYFENTHCLQCSRTLGYLPEHAVVSALESTDDERWQALYPQAAGKLYRKCTNYESEEVCNWMQPELEASDFCRACRLNQVIPNLRTAKNRRLWYRTEIAKRRLLHTLLRLRLPVIGRDEDPKNGLAFEFREDSPLHAEFSDDLGQQRVITGHYAGLITINIAEADPSAREQMREKMSEGYRTLLGHFRHESGHYYWDRLVRETPWLQDFRALFGDERDNYDTALKHYYEHGPPVDWQQSYVSAYAAAHPWEDWGESWAHYLHMVDTLETAHDFGFTIRGSEVRSPAKGQQQSITHDVSQSFDRLLKDWGNLTIAMNALNRSMGLADAYPFVLSASAVEKLFFVHRLITDATSADPLLPIERW